MTGMTPVAVRHDVLDLLISQHTRIRDLFSELESSTGPARREAFDRLVRLLAVHETIEEQFVHPLTRRHVHGGDDIVEDRLAEERLARQRLAALQRMGPDTAPRPV
ncbi:MAG TPA: hemerythrin domain-containing protein [Actinophytocola sp.]|uniref:hemerythrin domain-containing protein n=1 Tax=Actinophytocola sp. TaxID=1872138 RepID=UPI002DBF0FD2|nr:hemerythrin domain-containing protein [Actinophytocola sp.]HEU5472465.1 hemerythrin domain-containing protein [Actinophytocola sp.]